MHKLMLVVIVGLALSGCLDSTPKEPEMNAVMGSCESNSNFTRYVSCIKANYKRHPDHSDVKSLYARLDSINEDYENGLVSSIKAKAAARKAYDDTVGAGNARARANWAASYKPLFPPSRRPITCTTVYNTTTCD